MNKESLSVRAFAETMRGRMSKKAQIKNFDPDKNSFQSDTEAMRNGYVNLSQVYSFYRMLLVSIVYIALDNGVDDIPEIDKSMTSQLKNGKWEIHQKIKEIAQRKSSKASVTAYFEANLVANIPISVKASVIDDIYMIVWDSSDIKKRKRDALKQAYVQRKSDASYLAEVWILAVCNGTNKKGKQSVSGSAKTAEDADPFETLKRAEALLASIPAPKLIEPPEVPLPEEQPYISELHAAYGDKEGITGFGEMHLNLCGDGEYAEDLKERRIDYFAAESVRRGVRELYSGEYVNQFDILKDETFAGVINTARRTFQNGYERMLGVMEQAVRIQVKKYILSPSPNWISNRIRMGVCHFLVNDNKLRWVKK